MLEIWGRATSSNVQALMWCVGELGLRYTRHDLGHVYGGLDSDTFGEMNPNRTIPVLRDGDGPALWETGAILRYLAARYGSKSFWPEDPVKRAAVDKWSEWAKINVAMGFTTPVFWPVVRMNPDGRDDPASAGAVRSLDVRLDIAETQLSRHACLAGPDFTLADIQFGHILYRYFDIDIPRPPRPYLLRYFQALTRRAPYQQHVMLSYDELRGSMI